MQYDIFFSISQTPVDGYMPTEAEMFRNFFAQVEAADALGYGTAWVGLTVGILHCSTQGDILGLELAEVSPGGQEMQCKSECKQHSSNTPLTPPALEGQAPGKLALAQVERGLRPFGYQGSRIEIALTPLHAVAQRLR